MNPKSEWSIRISDENDLPFIYSTWMKSYRYDSLIGKGCRSSIFYKEYTRVIDHILIQDNTIVYVACHNDSSRVIFGYLVSQPDILHYAFTKEDFFRNGIAKSLYEKAGSPKFYTQKTFSVLPLLRKHSNLIFNPFILYQRYDENDSRNSLVYNGSHSCSLHDSSIEGTESPQKATGEIVRNLS